jgi:hypothetical protein
MEGHDEKYPRRKAYERKPIAPVLIACAGTGAFTDMTLPLLRLDKDEPTPVPLNSEFDSRSPLSPTLLFSSFFRNTYHL